MFFKSTFILSIKIEFRLGKCVKDYYGGCYATLNNFKSKEECESYCPKSVAPKLNPEDFCKLGHTREGGFVCKARIRIWWYNHT